MPEQLPVETAVVVLLPAQHADGAEDPAIWPAERQTAVGDHAEFDVRVVIPLGILEGIGNKELLAGIHDPFAIEPGVEVLARAGRVAVVRRLAGDEDFDLVGMYPHDEPGRHLKQLGHQIDGFLPGETQGVRDLELGGDRVLGDARRHEGVPVCWDYGERPLFPILVVRFWPCAPWFGKRRRVEANRKQTVP